MRYKLLFLYKSILWWIFIQALAFFLICFVVQYFSSESDYVRNCPTQYGKYVLVLFFAGLTSTFVGYMFSIVTLLSVPTSDSTSKIYPVILLVIAEVIVSLTAFLTWDSRFRDKPFDWNEFSALLFSLIAVIVSVVEFLRTKKKSWTEQLFLVDFPLFVSILGVIIFKVFVYNKTSYEYNSWITKEGYVPGGFPNGWLTIMKNSNSHFREIFWTGLTTGVIAIQMIIAQVASLGLQIKAKLINFEASANPQNTGSREPVREKIE